MSVKVLGEMLELLTGGITGMATGIGAGLNSLFTNIFLADGALSAFGGGILAFGGVALAIGLSKFVVNWLTGFGK
jgi:hypothetical protein